MSILPPQVSVYTLWEQTTGKEVKEEDYFTNKSRRELLLQQDRKLALKLRKAGFIVDELELWKRKKIEIINENIRKSKQQELKIDWEKITEAKLLIKDKKPDELYKIGFCTGSKTKLPVGLRNVNFLPSKQAKHFLDDSRNLEYLADEFKNNSGLGYFNGKKRKRYMKMLVVSAGWVKITGSKVLSSEIKRFQTHCYNIFKSRPITRRGVLVGDRNYIRKAYSPLMRRTELTFHRDDKGTLFVHLHAHIAVESLKRLGLATSNYHDYIRRHMESGGYKRYVHESLVHNTAEMAKYMCKFHSIDDKKRENHIKEAYSGEKITKTGSNLGLFQLKKKELRILAEATFGLQLRAAYNDLRDLKRNLSKDSLKLIKCRITEDVWQWRVCRMHPTIKAKDRERLLEEDAEEEELEFTRLFCLDQKKNNSKKSENICLSFSRPYAEGTNALEQQMLVKNFTNLEDLVKSRPSIIPLMYRAHKAWFVNRNEVPPMWHTSTIIRRAVQDYSINEKFDPFWIKFEEKIIDKDGTYW